MRGMSDLQAAPLPEIPLSDQEIASVRAIRAAVGAFPVPRVAMVLGSGTAGVLQGMISLGSLSFSELPALPVATVPGHRGRLSWGIWRVRRGDGEVESMTVFMSEGRVHLYEGHSARQVTAMVRILSGLGVRHLILTNAAGCINKEFQPGNWMMLADHLNLTGVSPLEGGPHFHDMTTIYPAAWREHVRGRVGSPAQLREGVYAGLRGPQFETGAEIRMLRTLGADAVGMSTVLEAIQARALGMEVLGLSCMTNWAAGLGTEPISHQEVLEMGKTSAVALKELLTVALEYVPVEA